MSRRGTSSTLDSILPRSCDVLWTERHRISDRRRSTALASFRFALRDHASNPSGLEPKAQHPKLPRLFAGMRAVIQRVTSASVMVETDSGARDLGRIAHGLLVLVGVEQGDQVADAQYIAGKIHDLRIFEDADQKMNRSVADVGGAVLVVSQFTLAGDCRKGRRPSFDHAAPPDIARPLYEEVVRGLRTSGLPVETGEFQASMQVSLVNDGPVTLLLDSRKQF